MEELVVTELLSVEQEQEGVSELTELRLLTLLVIIMLTLEG
jgi:hypothetical protein